MQVQIININQTIWQHILLIVYVKYKLYSSPSSLAIYYSILHSVSYIITKREKEWDQCTNNKLYEIYKCEQDIQESHTIHNVKGRSTDMLFMPECSIC